MLLLNIMEGGDIEVKSMCYEFNQSKEQEYMIKCKDKIFITS